MMSDNLQNVFVKRFFSDPIRYDLNVISNNQGMGGVQEVSCPTCWTAQSIRPTMIGGGVISQRPLTK
jgi:hypothetical protein